VIAFFRDWIDQFDDLDVRWELYDVEEGRALAITSTTGRGRVSGVPVEMRFAQLWTFRDGRFVRMVLQTDVDEALKVAPLLATALEGFAAYERGGVDAALRFHSDDVVWEEDPEWPDGQVWHGREGMQAAFRERLESTEIAARIEEGVVRGNRVLLLMRWDARGQGSGATAVLRPGLIGDFEDGLVTRVRFFLDRERARAALESD
jgi:ketosteroid isomerase-like protein